MAEIAPLVELLRTLADDLDAHGGARTRATYMSALREFRRVELPIARVAELSPPVAAPELAADAQINDLQHFKQQRGIT